MIDPFHDVRDKRMGELSPEQQERAAELWLRTNCSPRGSVSAYWWGHLQTLFRIIDRLRHEAEALRARSTDRRTPDEMIEADVIRQRHDRDTLLLLQAQTALEYHCQPKPGHEQPFVELLECIRDRLERTAK